MFPSIYSFLLTVVIGRLVMLGKQPVRYFIEEIVILALLTICIAIEFAIIHIMFDFEWTF